MSKNTFLFRAILSLLILYSAAEAQTPVLPPASNWENVKMLARGMEVRVTAGVSKAVEGRLESVTDGELVLLAGGVPQSLPRPSILSVAIQTKGHRLRNTLIGLGVGTLAGAAIGAIAGKAQSDNCQYLCNNNLDVPAGAAAGGILGLIAGTVTGALWRTGGWRKIYAP